MQEQKKSSNISIHKNEKGCTFLFAFPNIDVFSTPFDIESAELLDKLNVPAYKIASMELGQDVRVLTHELPLLIFSSEFYSFRSRPKSHPSFMQRR